MEKLIKLGIILVILSLMSLAKCQGQIISTTTAVSVLDLRQLNIPVEVYETQGSRFIFETTVSNNGIGVDGNRLQKVTDALIKAGRYSAQMWDIEVDGMEGLEVLMPGVEKPISSPTIDALSETVKMKIMVPFGTLVIFPENRKRL